MLATDWHYDAGFSAFYGNHLLADKTAEEIASAVDDIKETYYLGEMGGLPPVSAEIAADAIAICNKIIADHPKETVAQFLHASLMLTAAHAEELARSERLSIGTKSLIDGVSATAYKFAGLVSRTIGG